MSGFMSGTFTLLMICRGGDGGGHQPGHALQRQVQQGRGPAVGGHRVGGAVTTSTLPTQLFIRLVYAINI